MTGSYLRVDYGYMSKFVNLSQAFRDLPNNTLIAGEQEIVLVPQKVMLILKGKGKPVEQGRPMPCNIHLTATKQGIIIAVADTGPTKSIVFVQALAGVLKEEGKNIRNYLTDANGFPVDEKGNPRAGRREDGIAVGTPDSAGGATAFNMDSMKNLLEQRKSQVNSEYRRKLDAEFANFEKLAKNWLVQYTGDPKVGDVLFTYQISVGFPQNLCAPFIQMLKEKGFETAVNKSKPLEINIVMK